MSDDAAPGRDFLPEAKLAASLLPFRGPQLAQYIQDAHERRQRRRNTMADAALERVDSVETLLDRINSDERLPRALRPRVGKVSAIEPTWFGLNPNATKGRRIEVGGGDSQAGRQPEMPVIFRAAFHYCVIR